MTEKQIERQRHRSGGRYATVNPCEVCHKSAGVDYYSLPNCNETGEGLVLCRSCYDRCIEYSHKPIGWRPPS